MEHDKINFNLFFEGVGVGRWFSRAKNFLLHVAVNTYVTLCSRRRFEQRGNGMKGITFLLLK